MAAMNLDRNKPSVLLKHAPSDVDVAWEAGVSLMLCGHTHHAQVFPLRFIARMIFRGFDYGLKQSGKMRVYTSSGAGTWGPPFRVGTHSEIALFTLK